MMQGTWLTE